ncbi:MAG TPA: ABC transporter permease subunit [Candidatus Dormibacteraeota bacterium]|nr:ABC transporter permease subunit [Candidatus Dormibacteraeota bacterium]
MWFSSIYLKTLRDFRIAILGWGIGIGLLVYIVLRTVPSLTTTAAARASLIALAQGFNWLAQPVAVDTPGGYATFKYGPTILLIAIWALAAGARVLRGEEERGSMDVLLSLPEGRARLALEKVAAIWTALLGMAVLIAVMVYAGGAAVNAGFSFADAALFSLNLILTCGVFASVALLISQFTLERGSAAGLTGAVFVVSVVLDMVHRVIPGTDWISGLSPVYYYNLTRPLVPGFHNNPVGLVVLVGISVVLTVAAVWLFSGRDVGAAVALPKWLRRPERAVRAPVALPVNAWSLRSIYARSLGTIARPTLWWTLGIAGFAAWMVVVVKQTESQLVSIAQSSPVLKDFFSALGGSSVTNNASILSALFAFLPVALMVFALTQTNRWAADEEDGRLELVLATPEPRVRVLGGRFAALATSTVIIGVVTLMATAVTSALSGVRLDGGNLVAASLSMIPLGLLVAALGYLFSGWLRTAIDTGLLSFLLVIWVFISFIGPGLNWPDSTLRISPLYYYGTPLLHGLKLADTLGILVVSAAALGLASFRFARKDIGR